MRIHRLAQITFLYAMMLLAGSADFISASQSDQDTGSPNNLYHYYDCFVSGYACTPSHWDNGHDIRHESKMERYYRWFREEREREMRYYGR